MSRYGRRRSARGASRRPSSRKKVPLPKKRRTTRAYTRHNSVAINQLARDVKYLKVARYGSVQKNLQILSRPLQPTATQPCFCVINNIQADDPVSGASGAQWFQLDPGGTSTIVSRFERNDLTYFDQQNADIIDGGVAFLTSIKLCFRIFCDPDNGQQISNKRVRIDLFKQNSKALVTATSGSDIQQLPATTAQRKLRNMATPTLNKFNPEYFHLIGTKWCFLNPSKVNDTDKGTGAALKYISMEVPYKYLGRVTQQTTNPASIDDPAGEGWQTTNFPIHQRIWCMISCDDPNSFPGTDPSVQVTCQRYVSWRDTQGSAAL